MEINSIPKGQSMITMNLPNFLTLIRISLIPIFAAVYYLAPADLRYTIAASIFFVACLTDWLDGFLARKLNQESAFGKFLDPVADKLIVVVALVMLVQTYAAPWLALPAAIIICREIIISALREWMAEIGKRARVAVSFIGKLKTAAQMLAIILLISQQPKLENIITQAGVILLYFSVILTLWSMMIYLKAARDEIKQTEL